MAPFIMTSCDATLTWAKIGTSSLAFTFAMVALREAVRHVEAALERLVPIQPSRSLKRAVGLFSNKASVLAMGDINKNFA